MGMDPVRAPVAEGEVQRPNRWYGSEGGRDFPLGPPHAGEGGRGSTGRTSQLLCGADRVRSTVPPPPPPPPRKKPGAPVCTGERSNPPLGPSRLGGGGWSSLNSMPLRRLNGKPGAPPPGPPPPPPTAGVPPPPRPYDSSMSNGVGLWLFRNPAGGPPNPRGPPGAPRPRGPTPGGPRTLPPPRSNPKSLPGKPPRSRSAIPRCRLSSPIVKPKEPKASCARSTESHYCCTKRAIPEAPPSMCREEGTGPHQ
eukprot:1192518-Prorocentrum_minimum.AAC.1